MQHFPFGIRVVAGDATNPGTITHTTVMDNTIVDSKLGGLVVRTGNAPASLLAHTTITNNQVMNNANKRADQADRSEHGYDGDSGE